MARRTVSVETPLAWAITARLLPSLRRPRIVSASSSVSFEARFGPSLSGRRPSVPSRSQARLQRRSVASSMPKAVATSVSFTRCDLTRTCRSRVPPICCACWAQWSSEMRPQSRPISQPRLRRHRHRGPMTSRASRIKSSATSNRRVAAPDLGGLGSAIRRGERTPLFCVSAHCSRCLASLHVFARPILALFGRPNRPKSLKTVLTHEKHQLS